MRRVERNERKKEREKERDRYKSEVPWSKEKRKKDGWKGNIDIEITQFSNHMIW